METQNNSYGTVGISGTLPSDEGSGLHNYLFNIYVAPADVCEEIRKQKTRVIHWLIPLIIAITMGIIHNIFIFNQPVIIQKVKEQQEQQVLAMVKSGAIPDSQAEDALARLEKYSGPKFLKLSRSILSAVWTTLGFFVAALVLWLLGSKVYKADLDYSRAMEFAGIALMIPALNFLAGMFLIGAVGKEHINFGPSVILSEFDQKNALHSLLSTIDLMTLWHLGVLSQGLAYFGQIPLKKAIYWMGGLWVFYKTFTILVGLAIMRV